MRRDIETDQARIIIADLTKKIKDGEELIEKTEFEIAFSKGRISVMKELLTLEANPLPPIPIVPPVVEEAPVIAIVEAEKTPEPKAQ